MQILFTLLFFAGPTIQPAKPGTVQPEGQYVISPEGVFRLDKGKVQRAPKSFHPAFVFSSESRFKIGIKPTERGGVTVISSEAEATQVRYSDGFVVHKGAAKNIAGKHEIESAHAIVVAPAGDEYLLVRWQDSCAFTLFKIDGENMKEAAANTYPCGH
jgi:hypothetical protein